MLLLDFKDFSLVEWCPYVTHLDCLKNSSLNLLLIELSKIRCHYIIQTTVGANISNTKEELNNCDMESDCLIIISSCKAEFCSAEKSKRVKCF